MKYGFLKNGVVPIPNTSWVLISLGYYCLRTSGVPKKFQQQKKKKKKKTFSFIFSFGYVTKIDKNSKGGGNMNFRCDYMDVHFFHLLFWILICNLKII
jgi:hypothetical protein